MLIVGILTVPNGDPVIVAVFGCIVGVPIGVPKEEKFPREGVDEGANEKELAEGLGFVPIFENKEVPVLGVCPKEGIVKEGALFVGPNRFVEG